MITLIVLAALAQKPTLDGDASLVEFVKDSLTNTQESLKSGWLKGRITNIYRPRSAKTDLVQSAEVENWWDGTRSAWKLKLSDQTNMLLPRPDGFDHSREPEWEFVTKTDSEIYLYNYSTKVAVVDKGDSMNLAFLEINPRNSWFRCWPPLGNYGVPIASQVGLPPDTPDTMASAYVIVKEGDDIIKQTRTDPDGSVMEMEFSLKFGGNIARMSYQGRGRAPSNRGSYEWKKLESGQYALKSWHFIDYRPGRGDEVEGDFSLRIDDIRIAKSAEPSLFQLDHFLSQLPENVLLLNRITDKTSRIHIKSIPQDFNKTLGDLVPTVQGRGFLKK